MARILVIDDNDTMREGMALTLQRAGHQVLAFKSPLDGLNHLEKSSADLVVTDLKMDALDGVEVVKRAKAHDDKVVAIVVTAFGTIETAVEAMRQGAFDFLQKPFSPDVLRAKVDAGLELARTRGRVQRLEAHNALLTRDSEERHSHGLIGTSEPMQKLLAQVHRAAQSDTTVLIQGESGTGKELVAHLLHQQSPRAHGPFVVTHCAALAESLLESELFGHEKGAFTGAIRRKLGRFELADGGTLFLDEIGELSPSVQTKLLRVLQNKELQRVGGEETLHVDVRVVCATHRDLKALVEQGRFREDLYYRLHVVPLRLPSLRERPEDIPLLAAHFVEQQAPRVNPRVRGVSPGAVAQLVRYAWPGNVRELENAIEQALVFAEGEVLQPADLPAFLKPQGPQASLPGGLAVNLPGRTLPDILEDLERQLIDAAYTKARGVKTETARLLGIKTSALYYKLEKYGFIEKGAAAPTEPGEG